jgi:hypothetical protein
MNYERQAFEAWCTANGHGTLDDMMAPLDRSLRALMWLAWQAARAASPAPAGWKLVLVNEGFDALMSALERAHRKGYMPDAITDDYEGFDYRDATPQPPQGAQQEPLTNTVTDAIEGYKAGLAGEPMGIVSEAFDCGWASGDHERRALQEGETR